jgi:hypothetical protein
MGYFAAHMASASTQQVLAASRQWLKPVIRVLIRCGVSFREFSDLARTTFVEVATNDFGKRGRPTNVSRTAVLTGLARREVRKQREALETAPAAPEGYVTKGSLVLSAWHLDPDFLDSKGRPLPLAAQGEGETFATLVRRCGGADVPNSTLLRELRSAGAVRQRADGRYEPLMRNYIPHAMDEQLIRLWGSVIADVATTYAHNLTRTAKTPSRFERAAVNHRIPRSALPAYRKFLEQEGQAFLERLDAWLTEHAAEETTRESDGAKEKRDGNPGKSKRAQNESDTIRLGVGVYHVQD